MAQYFPPAHFQEWYPQWSSMDGIVHANCSAQFNAYMESRFDICASPKTWKADMAAAGVLLDLLPFMLSLVGCSTLEISILGLRRPVLALLLSACSPAVVPISALSNQDPSDILNRKPGSLEMPMLKGTKSFLIVLFEYIVVLGSLANIIHICWQLGIRTVCSFSIDVVFFPLIWALVLVVPIHTLGSVALRLRCQLKKCRESGGKSLCSWTSEEFTLSVNQVPAQLIMLPESVLYIAVSWTTAMVIVRHIAFGTIGFSSILLIGTSDALYAILRFSASATLCRLVAAFEISGMRRSVVVHAILDVHPYTR
ncbi:hypothetical protein F4808DRAFT_470698 [Astrocystis sublimbata]|nr:hypothetical protein F4808DRAFT_470698 [Astrocystis sublimbata]